MESMIAAVEYIETHPGVAAVLEVCTIGFLVFVHQAGKKGRARLHEKVDDLATQFGDHEKRDERVLGRIEGHLGQIATRLDGDNGNHGRYPE